MHIDKVLNSIVSAPCAVKWMEVHDVYSLGAKFQFEITDLDKCREACIQRIRGCVAIDIHGHFPHCFTHTQSLDKLEANRKPYKGYTQLLLIKECASSTLTSTNNIHESTLQNFTETNESKTNSAIKTDEDTYEKFSSDTTGDSTV